MELLSFSLFALWMLQVVSGDSTAPHEVDAIKKIISHWDLKIDKLNLSTDDPCTENAPWADKDANPRIACDHSTSTWHITHLKVYALSVVGEIPKELFSLTELMDLNLGQNVINGSIPPEIGTLSKMQYLALGINNLTGPVPAELGNLTKLISLSFSSNSLHGTLPRELGKLTSLKEIYIDSSGVSGEIPQELSNWNQTLEKLWASDNNFTGKIPEFLGSFHKLTDMRLEGTNLEGPIPSSFVALTNLEELRMGDFGGNVGSALDFVANMAKLSTLSLRNCRISDQIQEKLSSSLKLKILDLSFNNLTGQIPASFKNFTSLQFLFLGSNSLSGNLNLPSDIISPLNTEFIALDVSFNPLTGNISGLPKTMRINVIGTSIHDPNLNEKAAGMLRCLGASTNFPCSAGNSSKSFAVDSGGRRRLVSSDNTNFSNDSVTLGAASSYANVDDKWAISRVGIFYNNPDGPQQDRADSSSQFTGTSDSELYQTARISPSSLRYFGLGMENGAYRVKLYFAEIQMSDDSSVSWKSLARRLFDVYIQGEMVIKDLNIEKEAGGSTRALVKTFETSVKNTVMDIHLRWNGKGTCCIPLQSTYGPLLSAVSVVKISE